MGDVLDRWRLNLGRNLSDDKTQLATIASYVHSLDRERVPASAYAELYERVLTLRADALRAGKQVPQFGVELMLSCWPSLRSDLREREIRAGRTLTETAESGCPRCYGTGKEHRYDDAGKMLGVRSGCKHEHLDTDDPHTNGFDSARESTACDYHEETAVEICTRIRREIAFIIIRSNDKQERTRAWAAAATWLHAERYVMKQLEQTRGERRSGTVDRLEMRNETRPPPE